jgi:hypothetical protein
MSRYELIPARSRVSVVVSSTLHRMEGAGVGLEGFIEAAVVDGVIDLGVPPLGELSLAVDRLRSDNRLFDSEMTRRVDARRFPTARGWLSTVTRIDGDRYRLNGELNLHGVSRSVDGEADVRLRDAFLDAQGELTIDVRDFDLTPPRLLVLKVDPEVTIRLDVVARLSEDEGP